MSKKTTLSQKTITRRSNDLRKKVDTIFDAFRDINYTNYHGLENKEVLHSLSLLLTFVDEVIPHHRKDIKDIWNTLNNEIKNK